MFPGMTLLSDFLAKGAESGLPKGPEASSDGASLAFSIEEPVAVVSPAVFASPHSGRLYPKGFLESARASMLDLRRIEDAYVDRLLADVHGSGAPVICGLVARGYVDLNRAESEMDPAMFEDPSPSWFSQRSPRVEAGLGCIPRVAYNGAPIYDRRLRRDEAERRLDHVYRPYHRALEALLRRAQAMFGQAWLIDCHSMPAETEAGGRSPDIVIGDRFGASCSPGLADLVEQLFRNRGYTTARNSPYAGGFATLAHGQPGLGRHALQIEVRRRLYLDETTVEPHDGFLTLRRDLGEIAEEICAFARAQVGLGAEDRKEKAALDTSAAKGLGRKRP
jgi:N-formylglutamate amidohydrolase